MRHRPLLLLVAALVAFAPGLAAAQQRGQGVYQRSPSAGETRNALQELLNSYPPNVRYVLQIDPTLLERADYLKPYAALAAFVQEHPEIVHDPRFFLGQPEFLQPRERQTAGMDLAAGTLAGLGLLTGITIFLGVLVSVTREVIDYRRWLRQSRASAEAQIKVMDRLTSSEELLEYLKTPSAAALLQGGVVPADPVRVPGLPFGRILWSVQAGVVLAALGIGLWLVRWTVISELQPGFAVAGTLAGFVGIGFVVSAAIAFVLSARVRALAERS